MLGPSDSYESGEKNLYRRQVWNALEATEAMRSVAKRDRRVLILDEWKAEETKFLVQRGYSPENVFLVNKNVATAARAQMSVRQAGIFGVTAKGGAVGDVWTKLSAAGERFHAIHLDFCGNLSKDITRELEFFNGCAVLGDTAFAVNFMRAREGRSNVTYRNGVDTYVGQLGGDNDLARRRVAYMTLTAVGWDDRMVCRQHLIDPTWRTYVSSNGQPFIWIAGELRTHARAVRDERHRRKVVTVAQQRTSKALPPEWWHMPACMVSLGAAGGGHTPVSAMNAIVAAAAKNETGNELLVKFGPETKAKLAAVHARKAGSVKGYEKSDAEEAADPLRVVPDYYRTNEERGQ